MSNEKLFTESLNIISKHYNIEVDELKKNLDTKYMRTYKRKEIILPFTGNIKKECCKAVIYNHGLYTQCTNNSLEDVCKSCKNFKYGRIEDRSKYGIGEYITPMGKKEISYMTIVERMNYSIDEVKKVFKENNIEYDFKDNIASEQKKTRGRPKKNSSITGLEIEVTPVYVDGVPYLKSESNILLDYVSYNIVGVLKDGIIEKT
tara:strand:- start:99 stop:710 length:612 start_codon:yes stop_codon:yes gene_type:complete